MPDWLAFVVTLLVFLLALGIFMGALVLSANLIIEKTPEYSAQIENTLGKLRSWAESHGLSVASNGQIDNTSLDGILSFIGRGFLELYSFLTFIGLTLLILLFGLLEIRRFRVRLEHHFNKATSAKIHDSFEAIAEQLQRFILTKSEISTVTGITVGTFLWLVDLDFALIWGLIAFLLNYIPSLGSIISTTLISIFAFLQFDSIGKSLLVLVVVSGMQFFFGNWLEPRVLGRHLSLSPFVVVLSVIFWGWLWGIPGALLGVPLTIGIVNACARFDRTRWVVALLANVRDEEIESGDD